MRYRPLRQIKKLMALNTLLIWILIVICVCSSSLNRFIVLSQMKAPVSVMVHFVLVNFIIKSTRPLAFGIACCLVNQKVSAFCVLACLFVCILFHPPNIWTIVAGQKIAFSSPTAFLVPSTQLYFRHELVRIWLSNASFYQFYGLAWLSLLEYRVGTLDQIHELGLDFLEFIEAHRIGWYVVFHLFKTLEFKIRGRLDFWNMFMHHFILDEINNSIHQWSGKSVLVAATEIANSTEEHDCHPYELDWSAVLTYSFYILLS